VKRAMSAALAVLVVSVPAAAAPARAQEPAPPAEDPGRVVSAKNYAPPTEADFLRHHLKLPKGAPLRVEKQRPLPEAEPLKVYLALEAGDLYWADVIERVNKWNAGDARKYGAVRPVRKLADADVVLVRMLTIGSRPVAAPDAPGLDGPPAYGPVRPRVLMERSAPEYLYVAARTPEGLVVIKRAADWSLVAAPQSNSARAWELLTSLLKARAKKRH
jgi:hypothetical protein